MKVRRYDAAQRETTQQIHLRVQREGLTEKPCTVCHVVKPLTDFYTVNKPGRWHGECKECMRQYQREYGKTRDKMKRAIESAVRKASIRKALLAAYGGRCSCCGESTPEFLELDHKNGGGSKERKRWPGGMLYEKLKKEGFPKEGYRLLCSNCNHALGTKKYCPHTTQRPVFDSSGLLYV